MYTRGLTGSEASREGHLLGQEAAAAGRRRLAQTGRSVVGLQMLVQITPATCQGRPTASCRAAAHVGAIEDGSRAPAYY